MRHKNAVLVVFGALSLVFVALSVNYHFLPSNTYIRKKMLELGWEPHDFSFLEGFILVCAGILSLAGRGGINMYTVRTVLRFYYRKVLYGEEMPKISEIFQRDRWKPISSLRIGSSFIIAGVVLIGFYSLSQLL